MGVAMATITLKNNFMKKIYLIFSIFILLACSSTKQIQSDISDCSLDDKISETEKTINIEPYKKELEKAGFFRIKDTDTLKVSIAISSENWKKYSINKVTYLERQILYDKKTLKVVRSFLKYDKGRFKIGNEYFYNDKGEVIKTIDHNQYNKYPICYKDIIKIATKKMGKNYIFQALSRDSLSINNDLKYIWHVSMSDSISKSPTVISKYYKIDAKTGEILKQGFARQI